MKIDEPRGLDPTPTHPDGPTEGSEDGFGRHAVLFLFLFLALVTAFRLVLMVLNH